MGFVLRLENRKLSSAAKIIFDAVEAGKATVYVPGMVFAEALYLSEKRRIGLALQDIAGHLRRFPNYKECPTSLAVIQATAAIDDIPELHDRLIAGTARLLNLPLITNDPIIQASAYLRTIW
jgi:predicted nucleic acid-binding protein